MPGAVIRRLRRQQLGGGPPPPPGGPPPAGGRVLQISSTFKYESNPAAATCADKVGRMWVNGVEVQPTDSFRVTMNNFLATGGGGVTGVRGGGEELGGGGDLHAVGAYIPPAQPP